MMTYPGLPAPTVELVLDDEAGHARFGGLSEFYFASLHCCGNTGKNVDAPVHRFRGGRAVGPAAFRGLRLAEKAAVVKTGWSRHWRQPEYLSQNPLLPAEACEALLGEGGYLHAAPIAWVGGAMFPVRAYVLVE